jgi:hypothetical protein
MMINEGRPPCGIKAVGGGFGNSSWPQRWKPLMGSGWPPGLPLAGMKFWVPRITTSEFHLPLAGMKFWVPRIPSMMITSRWRVSFKTFPKKWVHKRFNSVYFRIQSFGGKKVQDCSEYSPFSIGICEIPRTTEFLKKNSYVGNRADSEITIEVRPIIESQLSFDTKICQNWEFGIGPIISCTYRSSLNLINLFEVVFNSPRSTNGANTCGPHSFDRSFAWTESRKS